MNTIFENMLSSYEYKGSSTADLYCDAQDATFSFTTIVPI